MPTVFISLTVTFIEINNESDILTNKFHQIPQNTNVIYCCTVNFNYYFIMQYVNFAKFI